MKTLKEKQIEIPLQNLYPKNKFSFVDLFSGIGGFRIPLEELGGKCLAYSEIDQQAIKVYRQNFLNYLNDDEIELGDITKIDSFPSNVDLIVGGVPCQPWSVAGKLKGFDDPRGKLWFDVIRLVNKSQPKAFIFENVRGLASPTNRESFEYLLKQFESINYCVKWKLINSYDFGVPQSRERVFIVGIRNDLENALEYQFPEPVKYKQKLSDIIDEIKHCQPIKKVKLSSDILFNGQIPPSRNRFQKDDELNDFFIFSDLRNGHTTIHSWDLIKTTEKERLICLTILKNRRKKIYGGKDGNPLSYEILKELIPTLKEEELRILVDKNILKIIDNKYEFVNSKNSSGINNIYRIFLPNSEMICTLTATGTKDFIATVSISADNPQEYKKLFLEKIYKPRKFKPITAIDCSKLQGFPDWFKLHENESIAKKQFGNAVSIPAVLEITKQLIKLL
ncbi:DNA cytosine methyltransferase [Geminocystis sp. CENA526]|uniref:DNA cytosine methyltransferase n=1 Tax=Geminocystis sp. CENA526 TaxID=1355871 RepID=UPI003D6DD3E7